jgi:cardiolipin synthase (CMP-forming)
VRLFDAGSRGDPERQEVHDRVLTVPNAITAVRLAGLPLFAWLVLAGGRLGVALAVLAVIAATDWVDGYVARRFDQVSRLGIIMDPLVDRMLLVTALVVLMADGVLPWLLVAVLVLRDVLVVGGSFVLFGAIPPIRVSRLGKAATAVLLVAVPMFLAAAWLQQDALRTLAWVLTVLGGAAYYGAGIQYARIALALRRTRRDTLVQGE